MRRAGCENGEGGEGRRVLVCPTTAGTVATAGPKVRLKARPEGGFSGVCWKGGYTWPADNFARAV